MHIIFDETARSELSDKHVVLELDTLRVKDRLVTAYCVVEHIPFQDLGRIGQLYDHHHEMLRHYKTRNWAEALDIASSLLGQWGGRVDSFYEIINQRLKDLVLNEPGPYWQTTIDRTPA